MIKSINNKQRPQETIVYAIIWLCVALLPVIIEVWESINGNLFEWNPIRRWWIGMLPLIILFSVNNYLLIPRLLKKGRIPLYLSAIGVLLIIFTIYQHNTMSDFIKSPDNFRPPMGFRADGNPPVRPALPPPPFEMSPAKPNHPAPPIRIPLPELFMLVLGMLTIGVNVAVSLTFDEHRNKIRSKDLENFRLQEELKYLKHQISPHFFMNVLNNIHELTEEDTEKAQEMIVELSQLMRHALYEDGTTSLSSELTFMSSYISLMRMRYPDDIVAVNVDFPVNPSDNITVPTLLFISFIENAFKHGVTYSRPTSIDIQMREIDRHLYFSCQNTIPPTNESEKKGGVGIANVKRRLGLLYGDDYSLSINKDESMYSVILIIPCSV